MHPAPARRYTGPRHHADRRAAALRRPRPAGLTSRAAAAYMLAAVALAGLIVITVSVIIVATGEAGGTLAQVLEACSGELALLALTVSVVLGVAATERHFLPPGTRVTAQIAHRAVALTAFGFLVVHILLETVGGQATPLAAVLPFVSASSRLYLGLGTIASDLVIAVIATSLARVRYSRSAHPQLWRVVHRCIYVAWPLAILHGILMPGVPGWAAWTYGICAAAVALATTARIRMRGPLPPVPTDALRELPPALPPGVAGLGNARPGYRRPVTASSQLLGPPAYLHQPVHRNHPAHLHQPMPREQLVPREQPAHRARPAHRPRIVARRPAHYRPEHPEPPEYPGSRPSRSARDPGPVPRRVPGSAPPWPPARHPTDFY